MASQGPLYGTSTTTILSGSEAANDWDTPNNALDADGNEATITSPQFDSPDISYRLIVRGFGFTLRDDVTIDGVTVEINRRSIISGSGEDYRVQLVDGVALLGANKADTATTWPTTAATATYGGAADLWSATLTPAIINSSTFGVALSASALIANADIAVDYIRVTVNYTLPPYLLMGGQSSASAIVDPASLPVSKAAAGTSAGSAVGSAELGRYMAVAGTAAGSASTTADFGFYNEITGSSQGTAAASADGPDIIFPDNWLVLIDGVNRTQYVQPFTGLTVEHRAFEGSGTARIPIRVPDGSWEPQPDAAVQIAHRGVELFEGFVRTITKGDAGWSTGPRLYSLNVQDYTTLLDDDVIETAYRSAVESDAERITWLVNTFGTRGVVTGPTVQTLIATMPPGEDDRPEQDFSGKTLREAIEQVARITGGRFYVDIDMVLHYFATENNAAPFALSDTPNGTSTVAFGNLQITDDSIDLIHEVLVVGDGVKVWRTIAGAPPLGQRRRGVLRDNNITSIAQANEAGDGYLDQYGVPRRTGTVTTWTPGLKAGQIVQITHQGHGLTSEPFRVTSVVAKPDGSKVRFDISFGDEVADLATVVGGISRQLNEVTSGLVPMIESGLSGLQSGGANLVANSDFEKASGTSWIVGSGWVFGVVEDGVSGTKIARADPAGIDADPLTPVNPIPVVRTEDYWFSFWTKITDVVAGTAIAQVREYNASDALLATHLVLNAGTDEADWTRHSIHFGPNSQNGRTAFHLDTTKITFEFSTDNGADLVYRLDAVQFERGALMTAYAPAPYELMDGQIVGPEIADGTIGTTKITDNAITTAKVAAGAIDTNKLAANAVVAGSIAAGAITAEHISAVGLDAGLIKTGMLRLGGLPDAPDVLVVYDSAGQEIGRWGEDGLLITDATDNMLKVRLQNGVLEFSPDGGTTWTTAISGYGISADSIKVGTLPGGHNPVPNSGFEITDFNSPGQQVWTLAADWGTTIGTDVNVTKTGDSLVMTDVTY